MTTKIGAVETTDFSVTGNILGRNAYIRTPVIAATVTAGTLISSFVNGSVIDGVTLSTGNRILIKNQATASENGIYVVNSSGAPTRATDMNTGDNASGLTVVVLKGTVNVGISYVCNNIFGSDVVGTNNLTFTSTVTTVTGTTNQIIASASTGAITLSLPQSIDTAANVQFATLGLGKAPTQTALDIKIANGTAGGIAVGNYNDGLTTSRYIGIYGNGTFTSGSAFQGIEMGPPNTANSGYLAFHTHSWAIGSGERMRIDKSGNVGIGLTNPSVPLSVYNASTAVTYDLANFKTEYTGSSFAETRLTLAKGVYGGAISGYIINGASSGLVFYTISTGTYTENMRLSNNNLNIPTGTLSVGTTGAGPRVNVLIGTSYDSTNIGRGIQICGSSTNGQYMSLVQFGVASWSLGYVYGTNKFAIGAGSSTDSSFTNPVFTLSGTTLGINNTSPTYSLDVTGTGRFSSTLLPNGTIDTTAAALSATDNIAYTFYNFKPATATVSKNGGHGNYVMVGVSGKFVQNAFYTSDSTTHLEVDPSVDGTGTGASYFITTSYGLRIKTGLYVNDVRNLYNLYVDAPAKGTSTASVAVAAYLANLSVGYTGTDLAGTNNILCAGSIGVGTNAPAYGVDVASSLRIRSTATFLPLGPIDISTATPNSGDIIAWSYWNLAPTSVTFQKNGGNGDYNFINLSGTATQAIFYYSNSWTYLNINPIVNGGADGGTNYLKNSYSLRIRPGTYTHEVRNIYNLYVEAPASGTTAATPIKQAIYTDNLSVGYPAVDMSGTNNIICAGKIGIGMIPVNNLDVTGTLGVTSTAAITGSITNSALTANTLVYSNGTKVLSSVTLGSNLTLTTGTLDTVQAITSASSPTFTGLTISGSTASTLTYFNASKALSSVTLGSGLTLTTGTLANSGVLSITGTSNQVIASASTGAVTLSLPQSIATTSTVQFGSVGVGMTPSALLDVAGFIRTTGLTSTPSTGKGLEFLYHPVNDAGYFQAYDRGTLAYKPLNIDSNTLILNNTSGGNVGIGVSPGVKLDIANTTGALNNIIRIRSSYAVDGYGSYISFTDTGPTDLGRITSIRESNNNVGLSFSTFSASLLERVRISAAGYLGVGTISPATIFHVSSAAGGGGIGILEDRSTGTANIELQFRSQYLPLANASKICGSIAAAPSNTGGRLILSTAHNTTGTLTERVRIDDLGYINFGTGDTGMNFGTSDSSTGFWIRNDGSNTVISTKKGSMYYGYGGATGISHIFYSGTGPTESMRLSGGYLGIGTVPGNPLDVWNNVNSAIYSQVGNFVVTNNLAGTNWSRLTITQISTNMMGLEAANQANTKGSLVLQPYGGGVGIGTTNTPTTALAVQGNIALCGGTSLDFSATGQGTRYGYIYHNSSYMEINNQQNGVMILSTNNAEKMRITAAGYVCIANTGLTSSTAKLQITGNIEHAWDSVSHYVKYQPSPSSYYGGWDWDSSNRDLSLVAVGADGDPSIFFKTGTVASERMRINSLGYVGINTAPAARLHVSATVGGPSSYANYSLLMYDGGVATASYGVGVEPDTLWYQANQKHKWYAGGTQKMLLDNAGNLFPSGYILFENTREIFWKNAAGQYGISTGGSSIFKYSDNCQYYDVTEDQSHIFRTNTYTERLRINSSATTVTGNLAVTGTTSSDGGYRAVPYACAGEIYVVSNTSQALTVTPAKLTFFDSVGISKNTTPSAASNQITILVAGTYYCTGRVGFFPAAFTGGNAIFSFSIAKNGTIIGSSTATIIATSTSGTTMAVATCLVDCAVNDVITLYGATNPNQSPILYRTTLSVNRVGSA